MKIAASRNALDEICAEWRQAGQNIAFVPTMGALHDGHLSLVDIARRRSGRVIVSIFVNPTQFAPHEDFSTYPRDTDGDAAKLAAAGVDLLYLPQADEIYPNGPQVTVKAGAAAQGLETDFRPHFFDGVATVVHTLFDHVRPDIAVFGEKDYQQLMVIREMVAEQSLPVEIIGGPIVRDEYGLALSSRNAYLSAEELAVARRLNKILYSLATSLRANTESEAIQPPDSGLLRQPNGFLTMTEETKSRLLADGFNKVDYLEIRCNRLIFAGWVGKTRLLDNVPLR